MSNGDVAMAKAFAPEMAGRVTDQAIQVLGGMGPMEELPLEMLWRDARVERKWDGTRKISATSFSASCCEGMRASPLPQTSRRLCRFRRRNRTKNITTVLLQFPVCLNRRYTRKWPAGILRAP